MAIRRVRVRVIKRGLGVCYAVGHEQELSEPIARALASRGVVEILSVPAQVEVVTRAEPAAPAPAPAESTPEASEGEKPVEEKPGFFSRRKKGRR